MTGKWIDDGLLRLRTHWPQAHAQPSEYGSALIIVPSVKLPRGYRQTICTVLFVAPAGFPAANPDHFYTDIDVELANGYPPKNTLRWHQELQQGNFPARIWPAWKTCMWWSWHLQAWNPNTDSLFTYMGAIRRRLALSI